MEFKLKSVLSAPSHKKIKILLALTALIVLAGTVSAAVFTMFYSTGTAVVKTPDLQFVAGSDSGGTSFPSASVTVASTKDFADVGFSLFPSTENTPQPATYYTDLLQIRNEGTADHTIESITISGITGATNLGSLTIFYYDTQTDSPTTGTPIASTTLTSTSSGTITLLSGQTIDAGAIHYIEIVGYAAQDADADSTIGFTISVQWT